LLQSNFILSPLQVARKLEDQGKKLIGFISLLPYHLIDKLKKRKKELALYNFDKKSESKILVVLELDGFID